MNTFFNDYDKSVCEYIISLMYNDVYEHVQFIYTLPIVCVFVNQGTALVSFLSVQFLASILSSQSH